MCKNYDRKQSNGYIEIVTTKSNMNYSFSNYYRNISLIVFVVFVSLIIVHQYMLPTTRSKVMSSSVIMHRIYAQQPSNNITTANNNIEKYAQKEYIITNATGHFANNQIKDGWSRGFKADFGI